MTVRDVYSYLPLATNAPWTIFWGGGFIKNLISVYKNPFNNCCQMSFSLSEYTKIDVGWDFAPGPTGGAYGAGFKAAASRQEGNGREGRERLG